MSTTIKKTTKKQTKNTLAPSQRSSSKLLDNQTNSEESHSFASTPTPALPLLNRHMCRNAGEFSGRTWRRAHVKNAPALIMRLHNRAARTCQRAWNSNSVAAASSKSHCSATRWARDRVPPERRVITLCASRLSCDCATLLHNQPCVENRHNLPKTASKHGRLSLGSSPRPTHSDSPVRIVQVKQRLWCLGLLTFVRD